MKLCFVLVALILSSSSLYAQDRGRGLVPVRTKSNAPKERLRDPAGGRPKPSTSTVHCIQPTSIAEVSSRPLTLTTEFQDWLGDMTKNRRLLRLIPVRNTRSLFWFSVAKKDGGFRYWVEKFDEPPDEYAIKRHIDEIEGRLGMIARTQQFLGMHHLDENSYLLVFYYEKK